jgi:quercetin dioxygenase-like cupin family protein
MEDAMSATFPSLASPVISRATATTASLGAVGATFFLDGEHTGGRVTVLEHPFIPKGLAAPMHTHTREDEYSYILEGEFGFQLGESVVYARPGDLVFKPRHVPHTFWNNTDKPARLLEIITPSGFERFFRELAELLASGQFSEDAFARLREKYGLGMDLASVPVLTQRYGLVAKLG